MDWREWTREILRKRGYELWVFDWDAMHGGYLVSAHDPEGRVVEIEVASSRSVRCGPNTGSAFAHSTAADPDVRRDADVAAVDEPRGVGREGRGVLGGARHRLEGGVTCCIWLRTSWT